MGCGLSAARDPARDYSLYNATVELPDSDPRKMAADRDFA
jgi:hypothetical protein